MEKQKKEKQEIQEILDDLGKNLERLSKMKEFIKFLKDIRSSFSKDGIQRFLRHRIAPIISERAREYLEFFNLDISDIERDENFDISLYGRMGETSLKLISGGEKVAVALALRLAIARVILGKISTIIMDEPTTHLDEVRRRERVKIMRDFLKEASSLSQMIIVTPPS